MLVNTSPFWHYEKDLNGAKTHASHNINKHKEGTYINVLQLLSEMHVSLYSSVHGIFWFEGLLFLKI